MALSIALAAAVCSCGPATLFLANLLRYNPPAPAGDLLLPALSVLIPARDEEGSIAAALEGVLASTGVDFEVLVMDDASTDRTAEIVQSIGSDDTRVRLFHAPSLPAGWNGKQHACWELARNSRHPILCFVDADVRLEPDALARMAALLLRERAALVSGFPRQITGTPLEWMLIPLIHFVLLGFLPLGRMRGETNPAYAAGCGQFLMADRNRYFAAGGHGAIRETMHDGLRLPRLLRQHGGRTDIADLTGLARCRMYRSAGEVWRGLAKNATEGLAAPVRILPISLLLLTGQILPFVLAVWLVLRHETNPVVIGCVAAALLGAYLPRLLAARHFHQSLRGALLHPVDILLLLAIQWYALGRRLAGGAVTWKTRAYAGELGG